MRPKTLIIVSDSNISQFVPTREDVMVMTRKRNLRRKTRYLPWKDITEVFWILSTGHVKPFYRSQLLADLVALTAQSGLAPITLVTPPTLHPKKVKQNFYLEMKLQLALNHIPASVIHTSTWQCNQSTEQKLQKEHVCSLANVSAFFESNGIPLVLQPINGRHPPQPHLQEI